MVKKMSYAQAILLDNTLSAMATFDEVFMPPQNRKTKVHPQTLFAYATDPCFTATTKLENLLETDVNASADLQRMLKNTARHCMPKMAAASSGDIECREINGMKIEFRQSQANKNQIYVLLKALDIDAPPKILFVKDPKGSVRRLVLPDFKSGRGQLILERGDPIFIGLMDINSEVYIS